MDVFDRFKSVASENAVLGSVLISKNKTATLNEIKTVLNADDFYRHENREIYKAMIDMADEGEPIDVITLVERLNNQGLLEKAGGIAHITELQNSVPSSAAVKEYAEIVREKALRRELFRTSEKVKSYCMSDDIYSGIFQAREDVANIKAFKNSDLPNPETDAMEALEDIEKRCRDKENGIMSGLKTGLVDLDCRTGGFQNGNLIILAARPAVGKTAFALRIASHLALKERVPVALFNLEMTKKELYNRIFSSYGCIDSNAIRTGVVMQDEKDAENIIKTARACATAPLYIDDTAHITVAEIADKAQRLKVQKGVKMLIVDYLQLITPTTRSENRQQEVTKISRELKLLAKELDIPVIALSQMSRAVETRSDKKPLLSDLRESGAIEQDADIVMFLYKSEKDNMSTDQNIGQIVRLNIAKHRNGATGEIKLFFYGMFCRFENLMIPNQI